MNEEETTSLEVSSKHHHHHNHPSHQNQHSIHENDVSSTSHLSKKLKTKPNSNAPSLTNSSSSSSKLNKRNSSSSSSSSAKHQNGNNNNKKNLEEGEEEEEEESDDEKKKSDEDEAKTKKKRAKQDQNEDDSTSSSSSDSELSDKPSRHSRAKQKSANKKKKSSKKRSASSNSSSVSDLLSSSSEDSMSAETSSDEDSSSADESPKKRKKATKKPAKKSSKLSKKKKSKTEESSSNESSDSDDDLDEDEDEDEDLVVKKKERNELEDGEIIEGGAGKLNESAASKELKEQTAKLKKKCKEIELSLKKTSKQLKSTDSSDPSGKKLTKRKKKLEKKYLAYKTRLASLMSREDGSSQAKRHHHHHHHHHSSKHPKKDRKQRDSSLEGNNSNEDAQNNPNQPAVKLPYPVLNDKRDMNTILGILKEKQVNLNQMLEQTQTTLASIEKSGSKDSAEMEQKQKRLRNLEDSIKVQLNRLNRQIDYIKLNVECAKIKKVLDEQEDELGDEQIGKLKRKMSEASKQMEKLLTFMKDANKRVMKQQSDSTNTGLAGTTPTTNPLTAAPGAASIQASISYYRNVPPPSINMSIPPPINPNGLLPPPILAKPNQITTHSAPPTLYKNMSQPPNTLSKSASNTSSNASSASTISSPSTMNSEMNTRRNIKTPPLPAPPAAMNLTPPSKPFDNSDPKAIAAMLNEKYGHKKASFSSSNQPSNRRTPPLPLPNPPNQFQQTQPGANSMPASFASMFAAAASAAFRNNQADEENFRTGPMSPPGRQNRRRSASPPPSGPINYPNKMYPGPNRPVLPGAPPQMSPAPQNQPNMAMMAQFSNAMMNNPAFMTQMSQMFAKMTQQGMNNPAAMSASIQNMQAMMANFAADYFGNQMNDGYGNNRPMNKSMPVGPGQFQGFDRAGDDALLPNPTIPGNQTANMFSKAFQTYLTNFAQNMNSGMSPAQPVQPMPPNQFGNNMGGRGYPPQHQQQPHMNQEFNNSNFGNSQPFYNNEYGGEHQYPGGANQNYKNFNKRKRI